MKRRDIILALLVVIVWGGNFTIIKLGLAGVPPILLASLRYVFAALPAVFFVKRPEVSLKYVLIYGLTVGVGQFSCLFYAISIGMPAGVSSIVLQSQAFFTLLFAAVLLKESLKKNQIAGIIIAAVGLLLLAGKAGGGHLTNIPLSGFLLTLLAASFWSMSNIVVRYASKEAEDNGKKLDMLSMVVWSSLVPPIPLFVMSLLIDKPAAIMSAFSSIHVLSVFSVLYLSYFATIFGYGIWGMLLSKYPAGRVAPLSLLVPVSGLITAMIVLKEKLSPVQWIGGVVVIAGLLIFNFSLKTIKNAIKK